MNVLIDTNVLLDIILEREPFVEAAEQIFEAAKHAPIDLFMSATTVTDVYYIARKEKGHGQTLVLIEDLLQCVEVVSVSKAVILHALHSGLPDFEDAVQEGTAKQANISIIVTRNGADFKKSDLDVYSPKEFVVRYGKEQKG